MLAPGRRHTNIDFISHWPRAKTSVMDIPKHLYGGLRQSGLTIASETSTLRIFTLLFESPIRMTEKTSIFGVGNVGAYSFIGKNFNISSFEIGRYCSLASYIREVADHKMDLFSTHPMFETRGSFFPGDRIFDEFVAARIEKKPNAPSTNTTIRIGNDVWIGEGVLIKAGVTIGNGAVIGANSFVKHDVPPYAVVVGCPAKVKRFRFSEALIERFERVQWWKYDLSPLAREVDFSDPERALDVIEDRLADTSLELLDPDRWVLLQEGNEARLLKFEKDSEATVT